MVVSTGHQRTAGLHVEPVEGFSGRIEHFSASHGLVAWNHAPRFRKGRSTAREDSCDLDRGQAATRVIVRASPSRQKDRARNCCVWLASMKVTGPRIGETDPRLRDSSGLQLDCDAISRGDGHEPSGFRHVRRGGRVQLGKHACCVGAALPGRRPLALAGTFVPQSKLRPQLSVRQAVSCVRETPCTRRTQRDKWLWSAKPVRAAISARPNRPSRTSSTARRNRRCMT